MKCDNIAKVMVDKVAKGELKIVPENHIKIWNNWLNNIQDWCISR